MPTLQQALAFKAYEIEELADVYFFRPLGAVVAHAARLMGLTPNQLSISSGLLGVVAGSLLYFESRGLLAFALLIAHSVLDSADGQLARMTKQMTALGRVFDSLGGHATHAAIYIAICTGALSRGGGTLFIVAAAGAALANFLHAQLYDYYRMAYIAVVIEGTAPDDETIRIQAQWVRCLIGIFRITQRRLIGTHAEVENALMKRSEAGFLRNEDRAKYCQLFYRHVRGWNFLGDNTRFYAIGVLAWLGHIEWFFAFVLLPMNAAFIALWIWQRRDDRRFLSGLS